MHLYKEKTTPHSRRCKRFYTIMLIQKQKKGDEKYMYLDTSKANLEIRKALQEKNLKQWQLADLVGINEYTLTKWLRKELAPEKKEMLLNAIKEA